jgi:hypothetical protein
MSDTYVYYSDKRTEIQWFHPDRVLSIGVLHNGNPIAVPMEASDLLIGGVDMWNSSTIFTDPVWGFFHEIGHNYQHPSWTWSWVVEVTCNILDLRQTY